MDRVYCAERNPAIHFAALYLAAAGYHIAAEPGPDIDFVLLPVPSFSGGCRYVSSILESVPKSAVIAGGNLLHPAVEGYHTVDFLQDPYYLAKNAALTADCALGLTDQSLSGLPVLILGWGRIGKCLGQKLQASGAQLTIAARKDADLAMIEALGSKSIPVSRTAEILADFSLIYNTIPTMILPKMNCRPECQAFDLASLPGMQGASVITARGLPGKYAPEKSGKLIAETFQRLVGNKESCL